MNKLADNIQQDLLVLPYMLNLYQVYEDAPLGHKHRMWISSLRSLIPGGGWLQPKMLSLRSWQFFVLNQAFELKSSGRFKTKNATRKG
ncbi:hypothetical protein [Pedobacter antarcticus]|uniref:hypothetical protein n=1 Tax=Pedobacter antarcticus TaxID=34086 RepID=UPI00292FBE12|nr:hypothetical protein [Pedobacter antarcticus]